jgi:ribosomal protein S11
MASKICKCYIRMSKKNVFVSISESKSNNIIINKSGGGYCDGKVIKRKMRRSWYLAENVAKDVVRKLVELNYKKIRIIVYGLFNGKVKRFLAIMGELNVMSIRYMQTVPHNGVRKKKKRRM